MNCEVKRLTLPDAALAVKKRVAPSTVNRLVRRAAAQGEGGTCEAQPRFALSHQTREILVVPCLMRCLGIVLATTARAPSSERKALWMWKS